MQKVELIIRQKYIKELEKILLDNHLSYTVLKIIKGHGKSDDGSSYSGFLETDDNSFVIIFCTKEGLDIFRDKVMPLVRETSSYAFHSEVKDFI